MTPFPPPLEQSYTVCPRCKREVMPYFVRCGSHVWPGDWQCTEHGSVIPMRSAVVNTHSYLYFILWVVISTVNCRKARNCV